MEYTLKTSHAEAVFSTHGGEMIAFRIDGKDILWTGDAEYWGGHAPLLFPFCSAIKETGVQFDGKTYKMGKHGFIRKMEFEMTAKTETHIEFSFVANEETLSQYPYKFRVTTAYDISDDGFRTSYTVENLDEKRMPYCIGGHPGFCTGNLEDWKLVFNKDEDAPLYYTSEKSLLSPDYKIARRLTKEFDLKYSDFDNDVFLAIEPNSDSVKLIRKDTGKGIEFDFSDFKVLGIWSAPGKNAPYVCLEPWNGLPAYEDESGNFEDKPYVVTLDKGSSDTVGFGVSVIR